MLIYTENRQKIITSTIRNMLTCLFLIAAGIILIKFNSENLGQVGMALIGCVMGGGVGGLFYVAKGLVKISKGPMTLLSADDMGIGICTGQDKQRMIKWKEIESITSVEKGIRHGVKIKLKKPDTYYDSLSKSEKKFARQNKQYFGSPASIQTNTCSVHRKEIVDELNKRLQASRRKSRR